jgi:Fe-S-cluster containining protein
MRHALCAMPKEMTLKSIDLDKLKELPGRRIEAGDTFSFRCYPGIGCYNRCCRNLNLFLYPYDVLRLKTALDVSSDEFLDRYVDVVLRSDNFFPEVLLRMAEDREKTCPFLEEAGCAVYPDRPDTCRTFPVEQGVLYDAAGKKETTVHFFRPPHFCLGQHEERQWTVATWARDQDAENYHKMTVRWAQLKRRFQADPWGAEGPEGPRAKMAFMATYNIDRFREFVFHSSFLKRYKVKTALLKKIKTDDEQLLNFGFDWVKLFLWGTKSKKIWPR